MAEESKDTAVVGIIIQQTETQEGIEVSLGEISGNTEKVKTEEGKGLEEAFSDANGNVEQTLSGLQRAMKHKMVVFHLVILSILLPCGDTIAKIHLLIDLFSRGDTTMLSICSALS